MILSYSHRQQRQQQSHVKMRMVSRLAVLSSLLFQYIMHAQIQIPISMESHLELHVQNLPNSCNNGGQIAKTNTINTQCQNIQGFEAICRSFSPNYCLLLSYIGKIPFASVCKKSCNLC